MKKLVNIAKALRKSQTDVVDYICLEKSLVIEADGGQHADNTKDEERDAWLTSEGFKV
jgi:very-short-patch-repair endonuclease